MKALPNSFPWFFSLIKVLKQRVAEGKAFDPHDFNTKGLRGTIFLACLVLLRKFSPFCLFKAHLSQQIVKGPFISKYFCVHFATQQKVHLTQDLKN